ncbi:MAG: hypothetical protein F4X98_12060 [Gammaproteobacteria bacterium]|nr:hypothetical protein [Gammaproteobacteria bacterium]
MYPNQSLLVGLVGLALGLAAAALIVGVLALIGDGGAPRRANGPAYTVWLVEEAVTYYEAEGREAAIARYSSPTSVDGPWYVFVIDAASGAVVGHFDQDLVGRSLRNDPIGTDVTGYHFGSTMADADEHGRWITYVFRNPGTGEQQRKHSWVVRSGDLLFGSGWYDFSGSVAPAPSKTNASAYAVWLVEQALARYERDGAQATLDHYNSPEALDGSWYVFVLEDRRGDLYAVANANRPDVVGTAYELIDATGFNYGEAFAATVDGGAGQWVSYLFTHPDTREDARKHTWIVRRGDLLFGAGWYEGIK